VQVAETAQLSGTYRLGMSIPRCWARAFDEVAMRTLSPLRLVIPLFALTVAAGTATPAIAGKVASASWSAASLSPGQYRWNPDAAAKGPIEVVVSIPEQMAYVYRGGTLIGLSTVSTGAPGHDTPVGEFTILQKKVDHKSSLYDDAPMPFMQRLTWDGIALHAGRIPGHPASHGCVRLPKAFAKILYNATGLGAAVRITDEYVASLPAAEETNPEPIYETDLTSNEGNPLLKPISTTPRP
jgi:hypothetical protein